jgi:hypothetical protein
MKYILGLMLIVFPLSGVVVILSGLRGLWTTWMRRPFLQSAVGTVIGIEKRHAIGSSDGSVSQPDTAYSPILRFTTESGDVREFRSPTGQLGDSSPYTVGMTIPVVYDPDDILPPAINSWFALWGGHVICLLAGPIFLGGAAIVYFAFGHRIFE